MGSSKRSNTYLLVPQMQILLRPVVTDLIGVISLLAWSSSERDSPLNIASLTH